MGKGRRVTKSYEASLNSVRNVLAARLSLIASRLALSSLYAPYPRAVHRLQLACTGCLMPCTS